MKVFLWKESVIIGIGDADGDSDHDDDNNKRDNDGQTNSILVS